MTAAASSPVQRPAPGRIWYVVGLVVFFAGMGGMGLFLVDRLTGMADALTRVIVPGEKAMPLQPGKHTIFHERQSVVDGRIFDSAGLGGLAVTVTAPDGSTVPLAPAAVAGRYSFGSHVGFAAFDFTVETAGDFTVAGRYPDGAAGPETVLAVGSGFTGALFGTIFGGLAFAFGGAIVAAAIMVTVLVRRRRAGFRL